MTKILNNKKQLIASPKTNSILLCCSIIAVITIIVFLPSLKNGFTNWDDDKYVTNNPDIKNVTIHNIEKIFSSKYVGHFLPLTMLTYMFEYHFFQLNPAVYHCTNLLLHIINCLLVFALIYALSGRCLTSFLVGLLFAIHPLRVESVAWIAELKDVLSSLFYFLSLLYYVWYMKKGDKKFYYLCGISLIFSLLSKPMAVSQPFVLILIYYLKNGIPDRKTLLKIIPFFVIAAIFAVLAIFTQNVTHLTDNVSLSVLQHICVPFYGMLFYLFKSIVPINLCSYYSFPVKFDSSMNLMLLASPFVVFCIAAAIYKFRARSRTLVFGSLFFIITLLPVLQIVRTGEAIVAERYTYIPMLGIYFVFAEFCWFLLKEKFANNNNMKKLLQSGIVTLLIVYGFLTYTRCAVWKDNFILWNDVIAKHPVAVAYTNRGFAYGYQGDFDHAIKDFNQAIALSPRYFEVYYNRGLTYLYKGNYDRAIEDFNQTIRLNSNYSFAYNNRSIAYYKKGDFDHAIEDCNQALVLNPQNIEAYYNRGLCYKNKGDYDRALYDVRKACELGFGPACALIGRN